MTTYQISEQSLNITAGYLPDEVGVDLSNVLSTMTHMLAQVLTTGFTCSIVLRVGLAEIHYKSSVNERV